MQPSPFAQRVRCLSHLQPVKMWWVPLYMFDVSFDFFFCIRIKQFYVSLKKKLWIRWSKIVVICFEVIISILLLSLCLQLTWMLLFCRSYVNIKTWKCNHVCYQQWVVTQALHPTESFTFLISRKLPTFYFFCLYFSGFCFFFFFFQTQGFLQ